MWEMQAPEQVDNHDDMNEGGPKTAPAPFNKLNGPNIILRTSDLVDFRVRDGVLAESSLFFDDMFSLPPVPNGQQQQGGQNDQEYVDGIPVIVVSETGRTIDNVLRFCYPVAKPKMNADEICEALAAARKYLMDQAELDIKEQFVAHAEFEPFKLYALAARYGWKDEMKIAAKGCLSAPFPVGTWLPEMEFIGAGAYVRLQVYHQACSNAAQKAVLQDPATSEYLRSLTNLNSVWFKCVHPPSNLHSYSSIYLPRLNQIVLVHDWLLDYLKRLRSEVQVQPRGKTVLLSASTALCIKQATRCCSTCAERVPSEIYSLCSDLASAVESAVSAVSRDAVPILGLFSPFVFTVRSPLKSRNKQ